MRRTEAHQGVRVIKFRSVLDRYEASEFNQMEAAELLGVSERTFRRWCLRYDDAGEAGLLDRRLGRTSGKRVPVDREEEVEALYRTRYSGFNAKHFHEHLVRDHSFNWGYTWTKVFLQSKGLLERASGMAPIGAIGRGVRYPGCCCIGTAPGMNGLQAAMRWLPPTSLGFGRLVKIETNGGPLLDAAGRCHVPRLHATLLQWRSRRAASAPSSRSDRYWPPASRGQLWECCAPPRAAAQARRPDTAGAAGVSCPAGGVVRGRYRRGRSRAATRDAGLGSRLRSGDAADLRPGDVCGHARPVS
jgi:transposase